MLRRSPSACAHVAGHKSRTSSPPSANSKVGCLSRSAGALARHPVVAIATTLTCQSVFGRTVHVHALSRPTQTPGECWTGSGRSRQDRMFEMAAVTKTPASGRTRSCHSVLLLWISGRPERQPAPGSCAGDQAATGREVRWPHRRVRVDGDPGRTFVGRGLGSPRFPGCSLSCASCWWRDRPPTTALVMLDVSGKS